MAAPSMNHPTLPKFDTAIIGGGIIGSATAYFLLKESPTLFDGITGGPAATRFQPAAWPRPARLHCRHSRGHGARLRADDCRVRQSYRALAPTRRFQYAMKAAVLDGALALLPLEKGARIPSTAEDV
jgi:glycine/D-amino acid oxidase-like deaminating enzyme